MCAILTAPCYVPGGQSPRPEFAEQFDARQTREGVDNDPRRRDRFHQDASFGRGHGHDLAPFDTYHQVRLASEMVHPRFRAIVSTLSGRGRKHCHGFG